MYVMLFDRPIRARRSRIKKGSIGLYNTTDIVCQTSGGSGVGRRDSASQGFICCQQLLTAYCANFVIPGNQILSHKRSTVHRS